MSITNGINFDSGSKELNDRINEWLKWDKNPETLNEIKTLLLAKEWGKLKARLLTRLAFGTAGLRGVMQAGFNGMNDLVVIQTAQGIVKYLLECFPDAADRKRGVVLGYDGRYNSKRFAQLSTTIFLNENIPVYLFDKMVPTPFVPFTILQKQCLAGIMVTASHNPKEDNGYKVYWENGAQIITPHDKNIQTNILNNLSPLESSWNLSKLTSPDHQNPFEEIHKLYYEKLHQIVPPKLLEANAKSSMEFVYTAMHGVGYPFVEHAFKIANLKPLIPVVEQRDADPDFPTVKFPNPEEGKSSLELSIKLANEKGVRFILANDPDADRLAAAEKNIETGQWRVFTGNELGTLLAWWAIYCYRQQNPGVDLKDCYLLASTVSSKMLRSIAAIEGLNFEETLTGFKWMGNRAVELMADGKSVLYAFEEAIGFMISPTVLDKDGVSAACHLATMCCHLENQPQSQTLSEKLDDLYKTYGFHFSLVSYFLCYEPKTIVTIFERIRNMENNGYPTAVLNGKYPIASVRDLTTGIDTCQPDGKALLPCSKSAQMITFTFDNGAVVTLRTSGTEPKIKYYAELCGQPGNADWTASKVTLKEMVEAIVDEMLQPGNNNLCAKSD